MTFDQFKETFDNDVKSEIRGEYFKGVFLISISIFLFFQGVTIAYLLGMGSGAIGIAVLYQIKNCYKITTFDKNCTNEHIEEKLEKIREQYKMDILNSDKTFHKFYYRPKGLLTSWIEIYLFYDKYNIYINARAIAKGVTDPGFGKRLEEKLVKDIKAANF